MKICMIGHKYVPSREGGIEIVVENLATRMVELGNDVTLFNRKRKEYKQINEYKGCKIKNIFTVNKKSLDAIVYSFFATIKAKKMAKKENYDVLHFHALGPCIFLGLLPRKKKRNYKIVATVHGLDWQRGKWGGLATKVLKFGEKQLAKYADEIIVLSENVKKYFKDTYNRDAVYIPNGVEPAEIKEPNIIKKKYGLTLNSYILFLARIVPEKGLHYLIEAWEQIPDEKRNGLKLVIAGGSSHSADYFDEIQNMIKNDDSIIPTGFIQGEELQELYSNAYLYVLPSDIEGMPMSLLEALSYGNTCLVSDIPENKDIISEKDFTFEKSNVTDLREKLINIIDLNLTSHEKLKTPFTWDEVVERTFKVYYK